MSDRVPACSVLDEFTYQLADSNARFIDASLTASLFCALVASMVAFLDWFSRFDLKDTHLDANARLLGLIFLILFAPNAMRQIEQVFRSCCVFKFNVIPSDAPYLLVIIAATIGFGCFCNVAATSNLIVCLGFMAAIFGTYCFWTTSERPQLIWFVLVAICFALWMAAIELRPLFYEQILLGKLLPNGPYLGHDTLYHCCLANMIHTFGKVTTGLDGTPVCSYHIGSHWLFAIWSQLLRLDLLNFYITGQVIVILPLMLKALLTSVFDLVCLLNKDRWTNPPHKSPLFWFLLLVGFVGFLPMDFAGKMMLQWNSILLSESYSLGMTIVFLAFSLCVIGYNSQLCAKRGKLIVFVSAVPALAFFAGVIKQSLLYCLMTLFLYLFVRLKLYQQAVFNVSLGISALLCAIAARLVYYRANSHVQIFHMLTTWVQPEVCFLYPFFFYFWLWCLTAITWRCTGIANGDDFKKAFRQKKLLSLECLFLLSFATQLPPNIIAIYGGSGLYFTEPQYWLALSLCLALVPSWEPGLLSLLNWKKISEKPAIARLAAISFLLLIFGFSANYSTEILIGANRIMTDRAYLNCSLEEIPNVRQHSQKLVEAIKKIRFRSALESIQFISNFAIKPLQSGVEKLSFFRVLNALGTINKLPVQFKKTVLMYIPRANANYWNQLDCEEIPFLAPALTGFALLAGLPPADCAAAEYRGYDSYDVRISTDPAYNGNVHLSLNSLALMAKRLGFARVLIVDPENSPVSFDTLDCNNFEVTTLHIH